jgi:hypothetical protein
MTHRSRLGGISIDCRTGDLAGAAGYWSQMLARAVTGTEPNYVTLEPEHAMSVEVQAVDHDPRVHLDIETDDVGAEVARLEALGATVVAPVRDWIVMQAPTGHRFCVVPAGGPEFVRHAHVWES